MWKEELRQRRALPFRVEGQPDTPGSQRSHRETGNSLLFYLPGQSLWFPVLGLRGCGAGPWRLAAELLALPLSSSYSFPSQGGSWWFYQPVASLQFSLHVTQHAFCGASSCRLRELSASSKLQRVNEFGYNTQSVPR